MADRVQMSLGGDKMMQNTVGRSAGRGPEDAPRSPTRGYANYLRYFTETKRGQRAAAKSKRYGKRR